MTVSREFGWGAGSQEVRPVVPAPDGQPSQARSSLTTFSGTGRAASWEAPAAAICRYESVTTLRATFSNFETHYFV